MEKLTDEQLKRVEHAGYLGFGIEYTIIALQLDEMELRRQFAEKKGEIYLAWAKGNFTAQAELRKVVMDSALNSSTPALEQMLKYFTETEKELEYNEQISINEQ